MRYALLAALGFAPWIAAQNHFSIEEAILQDPGGSSPQGISVALDGSYLAAGSSIYRREASAWILDQRLTAPSLPGLTHFGFGVDLDGDRAALAFLLPGPGGVGKTPGAVLFQRDAGGWQQEAVLQGAAGTSPTNLLHIGIQLEGERVVLASQDGADDQGELFVFERSAGSWQATATLAAEPPASGQLGTSVALLGDLVAAGQPLDGSLFPLAGSVVLFEEEDGSWSQVAHIDPPDPSSARLFGSSVALVDDPDGRLLVVGARWTSNGGRVHLYREQGPGDWVFETTLVPPNLGNEDGFGFAVAAGPDRVVASSHRDDFNNQGEIGSVHVFRRRNNGEWSYDERVFSSDGEFSDQYGWALDLEGDRIAIACRFCDEPSTANLGAAYPVLLVPRPASAYCSSTTNSSGFRAEMSFAGSTSVAANDLELWAGPVPQQFGIFFYGNAPQDSPFGPGTLCIAAPRYRLPAQASALGLLRLAVDLAAPPAPEALVTAGSTWRFQAWFRDPGQGEGFQLSSALALTFAP